MSDQENLLTEFAQAIVDLDTSGYCELGCGGYCYQHNEGCVVKKAQEYLKENT